MSFQAYLDTIHARTGMRPDAIRSAADDRGYLADGKLKPDVKAGEVIAWLAVDHGLGRGHAMAVVALLKGTKNEGDE